MRLLNKWKALFLTGCFLSVACSCLGAIQYGVNVETNATLPVKGYSYYDWRIDVLAPSRLSFDANLSHLAAVNNHMASVIEGMGRGEFTPSATAVGYFTYNAATREILTSTELVFDENGIATTGVLNAGDKVGFWVQMPDARYSSVHLNDADYVFKYKTVGGGDTGNGKKVFNFGTWYRNGYELSTLIGVEEAPKGQPLPSVLATLAAGACVWGIARRKRRA